MNISAKVEYACTAVLELASRYSSARPVQIRHIAEKHGIPMPFLIQILLQLKAAGLVASTRGAAGGYRLNRDPANVSLGEVMRLIDGQADVSSNSSGETSSTSAVLHEVWGEVCSVQREMLDRFRFSDLAEQARDRSEPMYYI